MIEALCICSIQERFGFDFSSARDLKTDRATGKEHEVGGTCT